MFSQTTDTVLMIEPIAFGFNAQTAVNNYFQQNEPISADEIQAIALSEFRNMLKLLHAKGITVIVAVDTLEPHTPDSIFPNNWISFQKDNRVAMYSMFAKNRRAERRLDVVEKVIGQGYNISQMVDYSVYENENRFLEGTGSMVFDRVNRLAYAALSPRTDEELFRWFCNDFGYQPITFKATQPVNNTRLPIYHTNVMLSVAEQYVVVCLESIERAEERGILISHFQKTGKELIEISLDQMQHFAGNVLQLKNHKNERFMVISKSGYDSLSEQQINKLNSYNELIVVPVASIEKYGGGSVRCMMAEVF